MALIEPVAFGQFAVALHQSLELLALAEGEVVVFLSGRLDGRMKMAHSSAPYSVGLAHYIIPQILWATFFHFILQLAISQFYKNNY